MMWRDRLVLTCRSQWGKSPGWPLPNSRLQSWCRNSMSPWHFVIPVNRDDGHRGRLIFWQQVVDSVGFGTIVRHQDPDNVREITGSTRTRAAWSSKARRPNTSRTTVVSMTMTPVGVCLGQIPRMVHLTPKCLTTSVTGGLTILIVARRHHTAQNVYSVSTNLATVSTIILCSPTKPTRQHSQIIPSSRRSPQFSQTAPQEKQEHMHPQETRQVQTHQRAVCDQFPGV